MCCHTCRSFWFFWFGLVVGLFFFFFLYEYSLFTSGCLFVSCRTVISRGQVVSEALQPLLPVRRITEWQTGWRQKQPLEVVQFNSPVLKQDQLQQVAQDRVQLGFEYLQEQPLWTTCSSPMIWPSSLKKSFLPMVKWHLLYFSCAHCFLSFQQEPLRRVWLYLLCSFHPLFRYIDKILHQPSLLEVQCPSSLRLSS